MFYFIEMVSALANDPVELVMQAPLEEREQLDFRAICKVVASCVKRVEVYYRESDFRRAQASQRWVGSKLMGLLGFCSSSLLVDNRSAGALSYCKRKARSATQ